MHRYEAYTSKRKPWESRAHESFHLPDLYFKSCHQASPEYIIHGSKGLGTVMHTPPQACFYWIRNGLDTTLGCGVVRGSKSLSLSNKRQVQKMRSVAVSNIQNMWACNLGIVLDSELSTEHQVNIVTSACFHMICKHREIFRWLPSTRKTGMQALITSWLGYGNTLYVGTSSKLMQRLQTIQKTAARLILTLPKRTHHSTPERHPLAPGPEEMPVQAPDPRLEGTPQLRTIIHEQPPDLPPPILNPSLCTQTLCIRHTRGCSFYHLMPKPGTSPPSISAPHPPWTSSGRNSRPGSSTETCSTAPGYPRGDMSCSTSTICLIDWVGIFQAGRDPCIERSWMLELDL